jgi:hypothetical protein
MSTVLMDDVRVLIFKKRVNRFWWYPNPLHSKYSTTHPKTLRLRCFGRPFWGVLELSI